MEFNDNDQRNILRLTSTPEWESVKRYLDFIAKQPMNTMKKSGDIHEVFVAQGEVRIIDNLKNLNTLIRSQLEG